MLSKLGLIDLDQYHDLLFKGKEKKTALLKRRRLSDESKDWFSETGLNSLKNEIRNNRPNFAYVIKQSLTEVNQCGYHHYKILNDKHEVIFILRWKNQWLKQHETQSILRNSRSKICSRPVSFALPPWRTIRRCNKTFHALAKRVA